VRQAMALYRGRQPPKPQPSPELSKLPYTPPPTDGPAGELIANEEYKAGVRALQLAGGTGFPQYAQQNLKVRNKRGDFVPFTLNDAQLKLHAIAKAMEDDGRPIRVVVLKARQMGMSTYIQGRQFYKCTRRSGQSAMTLAHELDASKNLLGMGHTFYDNLPVMFRPGCRRTGGMMAFPGLRSVIQIAQAKNLGAARSSTRQFLHGSEVAFWRDAAALMQGAANAVAMEPGTEIWLESTALGPAGYFYTTCQAARKGVGDYEFAFFPWFEDRGYVTNMTSQLANTMTTADEEYQRLYHLSEEQMAWRARKLGEFLMLSGSDEAAARTRFGQEFPSCPEDAFNADLGDTFIRAASVIRAREAWRENTVNPASDTMRIMGIDPSWHGNDSFRVWMRVGRKAWRVGHWKGKNTVQSTALIMSLLKQWQPDIINIDAVGIGAGVYDQVAELMSQHHVPGVVYAVMAGSSPDNEDRYVLKRDECWGRMKDWFTNAPQVAVEDIDAIQADLTSIKTIPDSKFRVKLESKKDMRKRGLPSPDDGDGLSLTFAFSDVGTGGRAGVRSSGDLDPNRSYNAKMGG
jgi:hypothetical protein